jgi:hypothetical protein
MKNLRAVLVLLLSLCFANTVRSNENLNNAPAKALHAADNETLLVNLKSALNTLFTEGSDYVLNEVKVTQAENGSAYSLQANASFLKTQGVVIHASFASLTSITEAKILFPGNAKLSVADMNRIAGQDLGTWLPRSMRQGMKLVSMQAGFTENLLSKLGITFGLADFLFHQNTAALKLTGCQATFEVAHPTNNSRHVNAVLDGMLNVGAERITAQAVLSSRSENWSLTANTGNFSLNKIFESMGISKSAAFPDALWNLQITNARFSIQPFAKTLALLANTGMGEIELGIKAPTAGLDMLFGISPGEDFKFSDIHGSLGVLDQMGLKNTVIVFATSVQESNLNAFQRIGLNNKVDKGLTLMVNYNLAAISRELSQLIGRADLVLRTTLSTNVADIKLMASLNTSIPFDDQRMVVLKNVNVNMVPAPTGFEFNLGGMMEVKANKDILMFSAEIGVDITNAQLQVKGVMNGDWNNPFGIAQGVQISDLGLGFGVSFKTTPIPLPTLEMKGMMKAGGAVFQGNVAVGIDPSNPLNCMVDAGFNRIKMSDLIRAFAPTAKVPADMRKTMEGMQLEDCRITVVPNPAGMNLLGNSYDPGFLTKGKAMLLENYVDLLVAVSSSTGVEAKAQMSPLVYSPYFSFTGAGGQKEPLMHIHIKPTVVNSKMVMSGSASVMGLTADVDMKLGDNGMALTMNGKIFNLFMAGFTVEGTNPKKGAEFLVKAEMRNDLFTFINQHAANEIDKATKTNQQAFKDAQKTITKEQNEVKRLDGSIASMRQTVQNERNADCAKFNAAKRDVDNAQSKVNSIQKDIDANNKKISSLKKEIKEKPLTSIENGAKITDLGTRVAALETAKATASGVLKTYKATLSGMQGLCKTTPIDLDPRVAGLITARHTAVGSLEAAKKIVEGTGALTTGSLKATKWIVENGNPLGVVNITSASFSGNLSQVNGGLVQLTIKGTFSGEPLNTSFSFNFNDAQKTVEAFARSLVN